MGEASLGIVWGGEAGVAKISEKIKEMRCYGDVVRRERERERENRLDPSSPRG